MKMTVGFKEDEIFLLSKEEYDKEVKKYPILKSEPLYKLNTKDKEEIESLNKRINFLYNEK